MWVLPRKVVLPLSFANTIEDLKRLSVRVESFASTTRKAPRSIRCLDHVDLIFFGNCGEPDHFPRFQDEDMANKIVLMQPPHDQNDAPSSLVVQPAIEGVVEPIVYRFPLGIGESLIHSTTRA